VFGAENRQRDGKAQVGQSYDPVQAASPSESFLAANTPITSSTRAAVDIQKAGPVNAKNAARIGGMDLLS